MPWLASDAALAACRATGRREIPAERGHVGVDHAVPALVPEAAERQAATGKAGDQREQREVVEPRPQAASQRSA